MTYEETQRFIIAALLHDIGKLKQRARFPEDQGKTHSYIGYEWLSAHYGEGLIAAGARNHHASERETRESNLSLIIYEADNLAASERKEYDPTLDLTQDWQQKVYLASEFSRIQLEENENLNVQPKYWPLEFVRGWIEPQGIREGATPEKYRTLWKAFENDFLAMKHRGTHLSIDHLLLLLEKHTSFVPSITLQIRSVTDEESFQKHPDVSLFDHLKVTAAAATSLYYYMRTVYPNEWDRKVLKEEITADWDDENIKPFLLAGGDLSGVQRFIYTISSKGALKSLKGRSFYLELLTEYVVDRILEEGHLSRCNVVFTGGGHFYILGPNTKEFTEALIRIRSEINVYLLEAFNGELYQCIEWVPMGKAGFKDATESWSELSGRLDAAKKRKWEDRLESFLSEPAMPSANCLTRSCEVCGREDQPLLEGDVKMCPSCRQQFDFGATFQRLCRESRDDRKGIGIAVRDSEGDPQGGHFVFEESRRPRYYEVVSLEKKRTDEESLLVQYRINDWNVADYDKKDRPLLAGIYHWPHLENLGDLARKGFGINRIAVLRMDVDHLGRIFSSGLSEGDRTFSRKASLSRQLSLFFKYHLNGILEGKARDGYETLPRTDSAGREEAAKETGRAVSLVYAGGDDLFVIGQWLDCLEAAFDINNAFQRFTGNPKVTLSGGIALGDPNYPVYRFADDSEKALSSAKGTGRNGFGFLRYTLRWREANEVVEILQKEILPLVSRGEQCLEIPSGSFAKGFLYRLLALLRSQKEEKMWILPKVAYLAGRNGPSSAFLANDVKAREAWMTLRNRLFSLASFQKLEAAVTWALLMMRKGGEE